MYVRLLSLVGAVGGARDDVDAAVCSFILLVVCIKEKKNKASQPSVSATTYSTMDVQVMKILVDNGFVQAKELGRLAQVSKSINAAATNDLGIALSQGISLYQKV